MLKFLSNPCVACFFHVTVLQASYLKSILRFTTEDVFGTQAIFNISSKAISFGLKWTSGSDLSISSLKWKN